MFNADMKLVEDFTISRIRKGVDVSIRYMNFALNEKIGLVEGFADFNDQVLTTAVRDSFAGLGAGSINILTFPRNDGGKTAASALNRVRSVGKSDGYTEVVRGTCNVKLMEKADELAEAEAASAELDTEFAEKTAATLKLSIEDLSQTATQIADTVAGHSLQLVEMVTVLHNSNDKITTAAHYEERLVAGDRHMETKDNKIASQTWTINQLNKEKNRLNELVENLFQQGAQKDQEILKLTQRLLDQVTSARDETLKLTQENQTLRNRLSAQRLSVSVAFARGCEFQDRKRKEPEAEAD